LTGEVVATHSSTILLHRSVPSVKFPLHPVSFSILPLTLFSLPTPSTLVLGSVVRCPVWCGQLVPMHVCLSKSACVRAWPEPRAARSLVVK
jgi:hypothetical protein